nr:ferrous iron transport protein A [Corynebacterium sp. UBA5992]
MERISDSDPELLQYFFAHGLVVGARVSVEQADPYSEAKHSRISPPATQPERDLSLGDTAARAVWVRIDPGSASGSYISTNVGSSMWTRPSAKR